MSSGQPDLSWYHSWPPDTSPWGHWGACGCNGEGVHLTKHQSDPQADDMLWWCEVVSLLTIRCLYWDGGIRGLTGGVGVSGVIRGYMWNMQMIYCKELLKTQDSLLQTLEHELRSSGLKLVPFLATRWLYWGYIWTQVSCIYISTILFSCQFYLH